MTDYIVYKAFFDVVLDSQEWIGQDNERLKADIEYINGAFDMSKKLIQYIEEKESCGVRK